MKAKKTIQDIRLELGKIQSLNDPIFENLKNDARKGVQSALKQRKHHLTELRAKKENFLQRLKYENKFWERDNLIAGVDEVGRGPLAGPVVTCAIILPHDFALIEVNDSKQISHKKRIELYPKILDQAIAVNIGVASNRLIDRVNIYEATKRAMKSAVLGLKVTPGHLLIDAMSINVNMGQTKLYQGDAKSVSIGAASIIAKVYRDHLMEEYAQKYPNYDFSHNMGYGTKKHLEALQKFGPTPIHRVSFKPVSRYLNK